jgi:uncharacterized protein YegL
MLENFKVGHFGFSGTKLKDLGASEYTLVTVVVDDSGSVHPYIRDIEKCLSTIIESCAMSPRADNLLLRLVKFNSVTTEVHGFKLLSELSKYDNILNGGGITALFDATTNAIGAMNVYGKRLTEQDYTVNGIVFIITDGENNVDNATLTDVKRVISESVNGENLESIVSVLIGVGNSLSTYLSNMKDEAGITQLEMMNNITQKSLAKLAQFISRSISSQSQALGTGQPSQTLSF